MTTNSYWLSLFNVVVSIFIVICITIGAGVIWFKILPNIMNYIGNAIHGDYVNVTKTKCINHEMYIELERNQYIKLFNSSGNTIYCVK